MREKGRREKQELSELEKCEKKKLKEKQCSESGEVGLTVSGTEQQRGKEIKQIRRKGERLRERKKEIECESQSSTLSAIRLKH